MSRKPDSSNQICYNCIRSVVLMLRDQRMMAERTRASLHEVVELTRVGKSVGCRLGLGTFEFAASFRYPRVVFTRRLVAGDVPWHARYGKEKCQRSHSYIDDIKLTGLVSPA